MSSIYGTVRLDPLVLLSYMFVNYMLASTSVTVSTTSGDITVPAYVGYINRKFVSGTTIVKTTIAFPPSMFQGGSMSIKSITISMTTKDGYTISSTIAVNSVLNRPGTYVIMYAICVRSEAPILFSLG